MRHFVQYHSVAKSGLPEMPSRGDSTGFVYTSKLNAGGVVPGDVVFLIVGAPKRSGSGTDYWLWCRLIVEHVKLVRRQYIISGRNEYLLPPICLSDGDKDNWKDFRRAMGNFSRGISPIDEMKCARFLRQIAKRAGQPRSFEAVRDFCDDFISVHNDHFPDDYVSYFKLMAFRFIEISSQKRFGAKCFIMAAAFGSRVESASSKLTRAEKNQMRPLLQLIDELKKRRVSTPIE